MLNGASAARFRDTGGRSRSRHFRIGRFSDRQTPPVLCTSSLTVPATVTAILRAMTARTSRRVGFIGRNGLRPVGQPPTESSPIDGVKLASNVAIASIATACDWPNFTIMARTSLRGVSQVEGGNDLLGTQLVEVDLRLRVGEDAFRVVRVGYRGFRGNGFAGKGHRQGTAAHRPPASGCADGRSSHPFRWVRQATRGVRNSRGVSRRGFSLYALDKKGRS